MKPVSSNDVISTSVGVSLTTSIATVCPDSSEPPPGPTPAKGTEPEPKSSSTAMSAIVSNTGGSLIAFTTTVNVSEYVFTCGEAPSPLSAAVTVIVTVPLAFATGGNVSVLPLTAGSLMTDGSLLDAVSVTV